MSWQRLPDCNGFARWRRATGHLSSHILANASGLIVTVEGRFWTAETDEELESGLVKTFERVDGETYVAALEAVLDAWAHVQEARKAVAA